jgi:hypothetical protein
MTTTVVTTAYFSPECRVAHQLSWSDGHRHCPGPLELRERKAEPALHVLRCACQCHPRRA